MTLKILTQLSHFITMLFGIALGMTLTILYQYVNQSVDLIIMNLYSPIRITLENVDYIIPNCVNDIQITENLGIIDSFEKYLENFKEIDDQKRKRLLEFGKNIVNEYENENE